MFIQTEDTPNPATLKFLPGQTVVPEGQPPRDIERGGDVSAAPLAEMLFMIPDVMRVFFGQDYISVTKMETAQWQHLKPAVLGAIMDFYVAGGTPLTDQIEAEAEHSYEGETLEIVEQIKELIDLRVRPDKATRLMVAGQLLLPDVGDASDIGTFRLSPQSANTASTHYEQWQESEHILNGVIDENGSFQATHVQPGRYQLTLHTPETTYVIPDLTLQLM